jgi:hypothetical protein
MIELAASLRFGKGENGIAWLRRGWSKPEEKYVWAMGTSSTVTVPLVPGPGRVFLELTLQPFVCPPQLPAQRLDIVVNGAVLTRRRLRWQGTLRLEIPPELRRQPGLLIELRHPDSGTPAQFGQGTDPRQLAFQLHALTVLRSGPRDDLPAKAGPAAQEAVYRFGGNEPTKPLLLDGWGVPEIDYVWSVGRRSTFRLPIGHAAGPRMVLLDMQPFTAPPSVPRQRIAIGANDQLLGFVSLENRTCVAFALPPAAPDTNAVVLSFDNMDAAARQEGLYEDGRPFAFMLCRVRVVRVPPAAAQTRAPRRAELPGQIADGTLADAVQRATGQAAADLAAKFEGLGSACELSLLQRRLGREPNGLLRFSGIMTPHLVEGICEGFWGLGRPDTMYVETSSDIGGAYSVVDDPYALSFQTSIRPEALDEAGVKRQMARGMPLLVRKFFEDAAQAEKIFVFQRRDVTTLPEAEAVLTALSLWGDVTLLWVQQDAALAGGVERLSARLLRGFVDFDGTAPAGSDESWLRMLTNAWLERQAK